MKVFFDSFAFIAWINTLDSAHATVSGFVNTYAGRYVTTEWILMEVADGMSDRSVRATTLELIRRVRANRLFEIVPYDTAIYQAGYDLFAARPDKDWSLTDCISFVVMARRGLTEALTGDRHFEQAGFQAIFKV